MIGLLYTTTIKTLSIEYDLGLGSMQGQQSKWSKPFLRVVKSTNPTVNGKTLPTRTGNDLMDKKVPLTTGVLKYGALNYSNTSALTITLSDPLPFVLTDIGGTITGGVP